MPIVVIFAEISPNFLSRLRILVITLMNRNKVLQENLCIGKVLLVLLELLDVIVVHLNSLNYVSISVLFFDTFF